MSKIAKALVDANVVKFGEFTLASGAKSPIYVDLRIVPSFPEPFQLIADELAKAVKTLDINVVAGAETAGIPYAAAIALKANLPMVYVRKQPKGYGTMSMIEGVLNKDDRVVLVDDLATGGYSKLRFIEGIQKAGALVNDVLIVLDREQGCKEALEEKGVTLHSLITLKELLKYMKSKELVTAEKYKEILRYLEENK